MSSRQTKSKKNIEKETLSVQKTFEERQNAAFKQFMKAHFGDPLCEHCMKKYFG